MNDRQERPRLSPAKIGRHVLEVAAIFVFLLVLWKNYKLQRQFVAIAHAPQQSRSFVPRDVLTRIPVTEMSGKATTLDFMKQRAIVAIVDPRCESCRTLVASLETTPALRVLSLAPLDETKAMARSHGLEAFTYAVGKPLPREIERQLQIYPQIFVVDNGRVVRTCATYSECVE